MKAILHTYEDYKALKQNASALYLPIVMLIDETTYKALEPLNGKGVDVSTDQVYVNHWYSDALDMVVPDFARVEKKNYGFYLEQSDIMQNLRDSVKQCFVCGVQFPESTAYDFCPECIGRQDIDESDLYKLFLRPVCMTDVEPSKRAIFVPARIMSLHRRIPELINGKLYNV